MALNILKLRLKRRLKMDATATRQWLVENPGPGMMAFGSGMNGARWGHVVHVIDGDTIVCRVQGERLVVRLAGIDAPELWTKNGAVDPMGSLASRVLGMIIQGEDVWIILQDSGLELDVYGRTIAWLVRIPDGLCPNLELVRAGLARVYMCERARRDTLERAEARARFLGRGIWRAGAAEFQQNRRRSTGELQDENGTGAGKN